MKGYVKVPSSLICKGCMYCGAKPIIALEGRDGYVVKCPNNDEHYKTPPGLIDIENWNSHNTIFNETDYMLQAKATG
jgi:hypothetical protein